MNRDVEEFLASFPFADTTRGTYRRALVQLEDRCQPGKLSAADLLGFISRPEWGMNQRYTVLCACRKYLSYKYGPDHPALAARVKRGLPRRQRVLSVENALELLASFDTFTTKGSRDLALAAVLLDTGLRCSEVCRLALADVDLVDRHLQVIVKGGQWAGAVFSTETAQYLREWIVQRRPASGEGAMFVSLHQQRRGKALTREGLKILVRNWGLSIGIKLSPHDFRRSFATLSTIFGAPSRIVQVAGRWSQITMVERYTQDVQQSAIEPYLPVARLRVK